ncbi:conserved hypothetical protein [Gammaproteobacteria bacterium]
MEPYEILTGAGVCYIAPLGTTFPAVNAVPGASWRDLGYTQDGLTAKKTQKIDKVRVDQETGPVKAARSEEDLTLETSLAEGTLENMADYLGGTVTDTPAGAGTIGTRALGMYAGSEVKQFAMLFRGKSAYGAFNSQFQVPVCFIDGDAELKFVKGGENAKIKMAFTALVDPNAVSDSEKFGKLVMQDAAAL